MEIKFKLSKYDILGTASVMGAKQEYLEKMEKYINEHESVELNVLKEGDDGYSELKCTMSMFVVAQIGKELGL